MILKYLLTLLIIFFITLVFRLWKKRREYGKIYLIHAGTFKET